LIFALMALVARRNFGPFALVAAPVLTRYATAALETAKESSLARAAAARDGRPTAESGAARKLALWLEKLLKVGQNDTARARGIKKGINLALVALLGLVAIGKLYVVTQPAFVGYHIASGYPARAARWLVENRGGEKLFNEYNWGGYLQWSLPGFPTFVDGRTDLFGDEVVGEWITVVQAGAGWDEILARYGANLVMVEPGRPLVEELRKAGWQRLYEDAQVVIYSRK
jgi:hypothetical protein